MAYNRAPVEALDVRRERAAKVSVRLRDVLNAGLEDKIHQSYARGFLRRLDLLEPKIAEANSEAIDVILRDLSHIVDGWSIRRSETTTPMIMRGLSKRLHGEI